MKVTQSCLILCNPMEYTVHGILQARILEWVGFPFSRGSSQPRDQTGISCIAGGCFYQLSYEGNSPQNKYAVLSCSVISHFFVTSWTVACQAPLCMGILQHKSTGVGCHALLQGIFPTQGSNPGLPHCGRILYCLEPPGKLKNTGVGSLSLLQGIFPTQELNQGLLHCRWILYQLSYQGSLTSTK